MPSYLNVQSKFVVILSSNQLSSLQNMSFKQYGKHRLPPVSQNADYHVAKSAGGSVHFHALRGRTASNPGPGQPTTKRLQRAREGQPSAPAGGRTASSVKTSRQNFDPYIPPKF